MNSERRSGDAGNDSVGVLTRPGRPPDLVLRYGDGPDHVADVHLPPAGAAGADGAGGRVPAAEAGVGPGALVEHCRGMLTAFAVPRYVRVLAALPLTPSQRVEKYKLRAEGLDDVLVTAGGIIPDDDGAALKQAGVAAVFGPGTRIGAGDEVPGGAWSPRWCRRRSRTASASTCSPRCTGRRPSTSSAARSASPAAAR